jgi:hypothetical protein
MYKYHEYIFYYTCEGDPYFQPVPNPIEPLRRHHEKMLSGSCFCGNIKIEYSAERTIAVSTLATGYIQLC